MNNENTQNVPEVIRQEAKARALKIIEQNKGCISYVRAEDLETASLFIPVVTAIIPIKQEFHEYIENIGIMPKVPLMNRIREAAGVNIHRTDTTQESENIWVAQAFGDKRMPDGTMEPDSAVYEFNAEIRAKRDFINKPDKYKTEIQKQKHLLDLQLFGRSKAETGAQLRLIAKLAKIERSFKTEADLLRGMILPRVDRNVNGILQDPQMRQAAIDHALGVTETVFGPKKLEAQSEAMPARKIDPDTTEVQEPEREPDQPDMFEDDIPESAKEPTPLEAARKVLLAYQPKVQQSTKAKTQVADALRLIDDLLANPKATKDTQDAMLLSANGLIDRCETYLRSRKEGRKAS